jgi:hypothetical protein
MFTLIGLGVVLPTPSVVVKVFPERVSESFREMRGSLYFEAAADYHAS